MKACLEPEEVNEIEEAAGNLRDKLLIRILFHLGCRITEALSITINDIDFNRGTITIIHLKRRVKISCTKCDARLGLSHNYCPHCGAKVNETS